MSLTFPSTKSANAALRITISLLAPFSTPENISLVICALNSASPPSMASFPASLNPKASGFISPSEIRSDST